MLSIVIAPHPPIIIPEIGRKNLNRVKQTVEGMQALANRVKESKPGFILVISPHGIYSHQEPVVSSQQKVTGNFGQFGFPQISVSLETDGQFVRLLKEVSHLESYKLLFNEDSSLVSNSELTLDHGAMVPLYYLQKEGVNLPGVHIAVGFQPLENLYRLGRILRKTVERYNLPLTTLISGDLSHRLIPGAPSGYHKKGAEFDQKLISLLQIGNSRGILNMDSSLVAEAGECGLRPIVVALGMLDNEAFTTDVISYEGPFGVGYLVAEIIRQSNSNDEYNKAEAESNQIERKENVNPAHLARSILKHYLTEGYLPPIPDNLPRMFKQRAGTFVSLKKDGQLRGCIGTFEPVENSLADEIKENAVSAALRDPRFPPVEKDELEKLTISVDVLGQLEKVNHKKDLDPQLYGVFVRSGRKSGLLLPDLEGVDTVEKQVSIACQKAGIAPGEPVKLYRFRVERYYE